MGGMCVVEPPKPSYFRVGRRMAARNLLINVWVKRDPEVRSDDFITQDPRKLYAYMLQD
jgi:hypothetical protein